MKKLIYILLVIFSIPLCILLTIYESFEPEETDEMIAHRYKLI